MWRIPHQLHIRKGEALAERMSLLAQSPSVWMCVGTSLTLDNKCVRKPQESFEFSPQEFIQSFVFPNEDLATHVNYIPYMQEANCDFVLLLFLAALLGWKTDRTE